jgi:hypothetical protein
MRSRRAERPLLRTGLLSSQRENDEEDAEVVGETGGDNQMGRREAEKLEY